MVSLRDGDGGFPRPLAGRWHHHRRQPGCVGFATVTCPDGREPSFGLRASNFTFPLLTESFPSLLPALTLYGFLILYAALATMIHSRTDRCITE